MARKIDWNLWQSVAMQTWQILICLRSAHRESAAFFPVSFDTKILQLVMYITTSLSIISNFHAAFSNSSYFPFNLE